MIRAWRIFTMALGLAVAATSPALATDECQLKVDWLSSYNSSVTFSNFNYLFDLAEDRAGNILACGVASTDQVMMLWRVEKLSPNGDLLWADLWSPNDEVGNSVALRLALAPNGDLVVAGWSNPPGPAITVRKYSGDGDLQWTFTCTGGLYDEARGLAVTVNEEGEIYAAGKDGANNLVLLKLNADGAPLWIHNSPTPVSIYDLAMLQNGDIVAGGYYDQPGEAVVMRYDPDGNMVWDWRGGAYFDYSVSGLAVDAQRGCFYGIGGHDSMSLVKFPDDPDAKNGVPEWAASYGGASAGGIDVDEEGGIWATGRMDSLWSIYGFAASDTPGIPPSLECITSDYNWTASHGLRGGKDGEEGTSVGNGIVCTRKGDIVSCGYFWSSLGSNGTVVALDRYLSNSRYPGTVANGSPTEPGPEHPGGLKPGEVRVAGGTRGLVDPRRGEGASVSVYPTSAGTVVLTVIDRKGGVVKQVSAPATGSGTVTLTWDGKNASGSPVGPGIYAVRVEGPGIRQVSKVAVVY